MLINAKSLKGYKLSGLDGEVGKVKEFYFDDQHWAIRYLIADTGNWLNNRKTLISPYSMVAVNKESENIDIDLTIKQIENSPSLDTDKPVSRQMETSFTGYYGLPTYWIGTSIWGYYSNIVRDRELWANVPKDQKSWDSTLRSTNEVTGYHVQASDGGIGHVADFIIDDEIWAIRYLVIATTNWWPGKKVLVSPKWIENVSWEDSKIFINLSRDTIKLSPEYKENFLNREYEIDLHQHYARHGYWSDITMQ